MLKQGDVVKIYKNPYAEEREEGEAKLLKRETKRDLLEYWEVEFLEDKEIVYRWIKAR